MQDQKLKGKTTKIMLAIAAILLVMGLVCGVVINLNSQVAKETPIKVKVLGISENVVGNSSQVSNSEVTGEGEEAGTTELTQISGKEAPKAVVEVNGVNFASKNHKIQLELDGADNYKVQNAILTESDITVKVGGIEVSATKKLTSGPANLNDGKNGKKYVLELTDVEGDGELSIVIKAGTLTDEAGNVNAEVPSTFDTQVIIDNTAPTAPTIANSSNGNWTNKNVTIQLASTDTGSGVEKYQMKYSGTNNNWKDEKASDTCKVEINETIYYRAIDYVGNISDVVTTNVKIDKTLPIVSLSLNPTGYAPAVTINVTSNGTKSNIAKTKWAKGEQAKTYFANAGENVTNNKIEVSENATYTVYVEDEAGNSAVSTIVVDKIDKTAPEIVAEDEYNGSNIKFTVKDTAPDTNEVASGVVGYKITDSDAEPSDWTSIESTTNKEITLTDTALSAGTHYIWVKDEAGNKQKKQIAVYYTLTFNNQSATTPGTTSVKLTGATLPNITVPAKTGHTFIGYLTEANGAGTQYYGEDGKAIKANDFTSDTTLYAFWEIIKYELTYDYQDNYTYQGTGTLDTGYKWDWSKNFKVESKFKVTATGKRYAVFSAYDSGAQNLAVELNTSNKIRVYMGTGSAYADDQSTNAVPVNTDITVIYEWNASTKTYTLTATGTNTNITMTKKVANMSGTASKNVLLGRDTRTTTFSPITISSFKITEKLEYNTQVSTLPTVTKVGYTYKGWYTAATGGTKKTSVTIPSSNTTIYAQKDANTYSVKYNGNNSTSGAMSNSAHTYDVAKALTANTFARAYKVTYNHNYEGSTNTEKTGTYTFGGWATSATGAKVYNDKQSVKNLSATKGATVNLYAVWTGGNIDYTPTRAGYTFKGWFTDAACSGTRVDNNGSYTPTAVTTLYAKWEDDIKPVITSATASENVDLTNYVDIVATDEGTGIVGYNITTTNTAPTTWIPVINGVEEHTETKYDKDAAWARVFHHNNHWGETYFANADEVQSVNTLDKYSVLGNLENYKNADGKFEFLLEYPLVDATKYNRWTQTANPATTASGTAVGYTAVGTQAWTGSNWAGLAKSSSANTFIDGSPTAGTWYYALGVYSNYQGSMPGPNSGSNSGLASVVNLWARIDDKTATASNSITKRIGNLKANQKYYVWVKDSAGNTISKEVTVSNVDTEAPSGTISSTNNVAASQTVTLTMNDNKAVSKYYWGTGNPKTSKQTWVTENANKTVNAAGTYNLAIKDTAGNYSVTSKVFYKTTLTSGKGSVTPTSVITMAGNSFKLPTPAAVTGYTFAGWYDAETGGNKKGDAGASYTPAENVTLYGHWTANTYKVEYYQGKNSGTAGTEKISGMSDSTHTYETASALSEYKGTAPTGWTFAGWSKTQDGTTVDLADKASVTDLSSTNNATVKLYAVFKKDFTVKSGANGGKTSTITQYYNPYKTDKLTTLTLPKMAAISNWTALGYRNDTTAGDKEVPASTTATVTVMPDPTTTSTTFYGVYSRNITVNSGANNATSDDLTQYLNVNNNTVSAISVKAPTAISGWTALGYRYDTTADNKEIGSAEAGNVTPAYSTSAVALYAVYNRTLTITYAKNSGAGTVENTTKTIYLNSNSTTTSSQEVTLSNTTYTRTGYDFSKWKIGSTNYNKNSKYNPNLAYDAADGNWTITATAQWTAKKYTVSFNANGGTGGQTDDVTATYAAAMPAISTTAPTYTGYTFKGWYDTSDATGGIQYYTATGASARAWNKTANTTLYARWIDETKPAVSNIAGGAEFKKTTTAGQTVTLKATDGVGITGYYCGTTEPTAATACTETTAADLTAIAGESGLNKTIKAAGTYWFAVRDAAGNWDKKSITIVSYTVNDLLETIAGVRNAFTSENYTSAASSTYIIKEGTTLTLNKIGTLPTGAKDFMGYSTTYSTTAATPSTTAPKAANNTTYYMWFNRNAYKVTITKPTNGSVKAETVTYKNNSVTATTAAEELQVKYGDTVKATATASEGYTFTGWSGGYLTENTTNPSTGAEVTEDKTITATFADKTAPAVSDIEGGTGFKKKTTAGQTVTLKATDGVGITGYYWGTTEPTAATACTETTAADLTAIAGESGLSKTITAAGTYWFAARDAAGNYAKKSIKIISYKVNNVLENIAGARGTYTSANYTKGTDNTYIIKDGTSLTLASTYTIPTGAAEGTFKGYSTGFTTTAATPSTTAPKAANNATYYMWFDRNTYKLTVSKPTNGSVKAETVTQGSNSVTATTAAAELTVKYGDTVKATATASSGYTFTGWSGGYLTENITNPSTGAEVTEDKTITATFADITAPILNSINVTAPNAGTYKAGQAITMVATYNENIYGTNAAVAVTAGTAPTLKIKFGTSTERTATFSKTSGKTITYTYTIASGDNGTLAVTGYTGTVYDAAGNSLSVAKKAIGGKAIVADTTAPTITASPASATACKSADVTLTVEDTGAGASGLATTNSYQYYLSSSSTDLNGGAWTDYTPGTAFTIGTGINGTGYLFVKRVGDVVGNKSTEGGNTGTVGGIECHGFGPYVFDNTAPTLSSINVTAPNAGTYKAGQAVTIVATYDENIYGTSAGAAVTAETAPALSLKFGSTAAKGNSGKAKFSSANGATITYTYTVTEGDNGALTTSGYTGTVYDAAGNNLSVTNKTIGGKAIVADTTDPTITASPASATACKSANVTLTVEDTGAGASGLATTNSYQYYLSSSTSALSGGEWTNYTPGTAFTIGTGKTGTRYLFVKRVGDVVGNLSTEGGNQVIISGTGYHGFGPYVFDNTAPTLSSINVTAPNEGTYKEGQAVTIVATYNENIYGTNAGVAVTAETAPTLKIKFGTSTERTATFNKTSGKTITYTYTVTEGDNGALAVTGYTGTVYDAAGNSLSVAKKAIGGNAIVADTTAPTITASPASATACKSADVTLTVEDTGAGASGLATTNSYQYYLSKSTTALSGGTWTNYTPGTAFTIGTGITGTRYLFVKRVGDVVGNLSTEGGNQVMISGTGYHGFGPYVFDNTAPTLSSINVTAPNEGTYKEGQAVTIVATYNENIYGTNAGAAVTAETAPTLKIKFGTSTERTATFSKTSGKTITYTYTVTDGDNGALTTSGYTGTVYDAAGNSLSVAKKAIGGKAIVADTTAPTITASPASATACKSADVTLTVEDTGAGASGLATTNSYQYYLSSSSTDLNGGAWTDYTPGTAFTIGTGINGTGYLFVKRVGDVVGNKSTEGGNTGTVGGIECHGFGPYVFDNTAPTLSSINVTAPNAGTYKAGQAVTIVATYDENIYGTNAAAAVTAETAPTLKIKFGTSTERTATFSKTSGKTITYTYTIASGDNGALAVTGHSGTVYDAAGNSLSVAKKAIGGNAIVADTTGPIVSSIDAFGPQPGPISAVFKAEVEIPLIVTFNEEAYRNASKATITSATAPILTIKFGSGENRTATFVSASENIVNYKYVIQNGDNGKLESVSYSGMVYDNLGNSATTSSKEITGVQVTADTIAPTITVSPASATTCKSKDVTITLADTGTGASELPTSNSYQYYLSSSSTALSGGTWTDYTPGTAFTIGTGLTGTRYLFVKRVTDLAKNESTTGGTATTIGDTIYQRFGKYVFDNTAPKLSSINVTAPNEGTYKEGQAVTIVATYNENIYGTNAGAAVTAETAPTLKIKFGTSTERTATFSKTSGKTITYTYTIASGDNGTLAVTGYTGTVYDVVGNSLSVAKKEIGGNAIVADTTAPTITASPASATACKSADVTLTVEDTGAGASGLATTNSYQYYLSKSTTALSGGTWTNYTPGTAFTIGTGKTGTRYLFVKRVGDVVGNLSTEGGNQVIISGTGYHGFGPYVFDNTAPTLSSINVTAPNEGTYKEGQAVTIVATYNENIYGTNAGAAVTAETAPALSLKFGSTAAKGNSGKAKFSSANGATITYTYTVTEGDNGALTTSGYTGTVYDAAGNNLSVTNKTIGGKAIVADTTDPTITASPASATACKSADVTLTVEDTGTGASGLATTNSYQYYLSKSTTALSGGTWTNYTPGTAFTIGTGITGTRYLFVKRVGDVVGNLSTEGGNQVIISGTGYHGFGPYVFDNTAPTLSGSAIANIDSANQLTFTLTISSAGDTGNGLSGYRVYNGDTALGSLVSTTATSGTGTITLSNDVNWQSNDLVVKAVDKAGNTSAGIPIDYYTVNSIDGLKGLADCVNSASATNTETQRRFKNRTVKQIANIAPSSVQTLTPIGKRTVDTSSNNTYYGFEGTYDGQNKTIKNVKFDASTSIYDIALFGVANNATIQNVNITVTATSASLAYTGCKSPRMGGIVASSLGSTVIQNCTVNGAITTVIKSSKDDICHIGGICGYAGNTTQIISCTNNAAITGTKSSEVVALKPRTGGIAGSMSADAEIKGTGSLNMKNTGKIVGNFITGGISAYAEGNIEYCLNTGAVSNNVTYGDADYADGIGGIVGKVQSTGRVENCRNEGNITSNLVNEYGNAGVGGVAGRNFDGSMKNVENSGEVVANNGAGVGGIVGIHAIGAYLGSDRINMKLGGMYTHNTGTVTAYGQNLVDNSTVELGSVNLGGICGQNLGGIINYAINEGKVEAKTGAGKHTGGIVGANQKFDPNEIAGYEEYTEGKIAEVMMCSNRASVTGTDQVGGVAGLNYSFSISDSYISSCSNTGSVKATGDYVGGIVGNNNKAEVEYSYNRGNAQGSGSYYGGIAGRNNIGGMIEYCYTTSCGNKTSSYYAITSKNDGTVSNTYYLDYIGPNMSDTLGEGAVKDSGYIKTLPGREKWSDYFRLDVGNNNSGYPILSFEYLNYEPETNKIYYAFKTNPTSDGAPTINASQQTVKTNGKTVYICIVEGATIKGYTTWTASASNSAPNFYYKSDGSCLTMSNNTTPSSLIGAGVLELGAGNRTLKITSSGLKGCIEL